MGCTSQIQQLYTLTDTEGDPCKCSPAQTEGLVSRSRIEFYGSAFGPQGLGLIRPCDFGPIRA
eukprot:657767-Rhodomonas_salina.2